MPETDWTNDGLRTFLTALRATGIFTAGEEELDHDGVRRQALSRIVPEIRRRVLSAVGARVDPQERRLSSSRWGTRRGTPSKPGSW